MRPHSRKQQVTATRRETVEGLACQGAPRARYVARGGAFYFGYFYFPAVRPGVGGG